MPDVRTIRASETTNGAQVIFFQLLPAANAFRRSILHLCYARFFPEFEACSAVVVANRCMALAIIPVHPVWWLAPSPAPLSPWKYS